MASTTDASGSSSIHADHSSHHLHRDCILRESISCFNRFVTRHWVVRQNRSSERCLAGGNTPARFLCAVRLHSIPWRMDVSATVAARIQHEVTEIAEVLARRQGKTVREVWSEALNPTARLLGCPEPRSAAIGHTWSFSPRGQLDIRRHRPSPRRSSLLALACKGVPARECPASFA